MFHLPAKKHPIFHPFWDLSQKNRNFGKTYPLLKRIIPNFFLYYKEVTKDTEQNVKCLRLRPGCPNEPWPRLSPLHLTIRALLPICRMPAKVAGLGGFRYLGFPTWTYFAIHLNLGTYLTIKPLPAACQGRWPAREGSMPNLPGTSKMMRPGKGEP